MAESEKDLADVLGTIQADIASLSRTVSQLLSKSANIHHTLRQRLSDVGYAAEQGAEAIVTEVQGEIVRNPLASVTIAAGVGFTLGLLAGGSRSPPQRTAHRRR